MTTTNSWKLTAVSFIVAIVLPLVSGPLAEHGIVLTEAQIQNYMYVFFGISGIGAASSAAKRIEKRKQKVADTASTTVTATVAQAVAPPIVPGPHIPQFTSKHSWYESNFKEDEKRGNVIEYGEPYLWFRVKGVRTYFIAKLKEQNGTLIQIDQSGYAGNPWSDTIRLEMFRNRNGEMEPLPRGKYSIEIQGDKGTSDAIGANSDKFEIV